MKKTRNIFMRDIIQGELLVLLCDAACVNATANNTPASCTSPTTLPVPNGINEQWDEWITIEISFYLAES